MERTPGVMEKTVPVAGLRRAVRSLERVAWSWARGLILVLPGLASDPHATCGGDSPIQDVGALEVDRCLPRPAAAIHPRRGRVLELDRLLPLPAKAARPL